MRRSELVAYTDESGNTGNNLFDSNQPWFWTGTLLAPMDFDQIATGHMRKWRDRLSVEELHGSEIGLKRLERIAHGIDVFVRMHDLRFVFAGVEKSHLAATKFTDTFLDDGNNKAVSPLHYRVRGFRVRFAAIADAFMTLEDRKEFWLSYMDQDFDAFRNVATRFNAWVRSHSILDQRTKEILGEALEWAIAHPESVLPVRANDLDAPNTVALQVLMISLHQMFDGKDHRIQRFIHDETSQFAKAFKLQYAVSKAIGHPSLLPTSLTGDRTETLTFDCPIEMGVSRDSPGLQLVDLILWLVRKAVGGAVVGRPNCERLFGTITGRSAVQLFSTQGMRERAGEMCRQTMTIELSPESKQRAEGIISRLEENRQKRLREPL